MEILIIENESVFDISFLKIALLIFKYFKYMMLVMDFCR